MVKGVCRFCVEVECNLGGSENIVWKVGESLIGPASNTGTFVNFWLNGGTNLDAHSFTNYELYFVRYLEPTKGITRML